MILGTALYFAPTIVAVARHSRRPVAIFFFNLFLGWTIIGWAIALVWALRTEPAYAYPYAYGTYSPYTPYRRF